MVLPDGSEGVVSLGRHRSVGSLNAGMHLSKSAEVLGIGAAPF